MNIVVLSRNPSLYSTQAIVDAGRKKHHYVRVLDHMFCDLLIEKDKLEIYYNFQKLENVHAVIPRIGTTATSFGSSVIRQFEAMGIFTTLKAEALLKARNKLTCMQLLSGAGLGVARTGITNNLYTLPFIIDKVSTAPYIVKLATGTQGLGVILSESKSNAESIVEAFQKTEEKVLIQQFIEEARGSDIRVFVIDGEIVGAMKRQAKNGEFRSNLHRGAQSEKVVLTSEEEEVALKATKIMGLHIAGVDMLRSHTGPLILEVNASPGLEGIEGTTQIDIAGKIIEFIERKVIV
ncbi:MAG: RimK family alpha-L-glutamate ligase [Saprospiraceae bacterium]|jgi:ribosomal protein S6--L-glutamate ligase|nr:RimK family alpha-L-glutamate ligase [Saprospiraceae bacterium]MBP9195082.1 RimK family alpha-L-glutamate ligase [Saprospiraceae bacterium]